MAYRRRPFRSAFVDDEADDIGDIYFQDVPAYRPPVIAPAFPTQKNATIRELVETLVANLDKFEELKRTHSYFYFQNLQKLEQFVSKIRAIAIHDDRKQIVWNPLPIEPTFPSISFSVVYVVTMRLSRYNNRV